MSRIVVALGGNALGKTPNEQIELVKNTAKPLVDLIEDNHELILTHGNGPQVGIINLAMEIASKSEEHTPEMPFPECGAMSQGYIGYHLQNALRTELLNRNISKSVATIVTQVIVDKNDYAFNNPTKPIGKFYTKDEAQKLSKQKGYIVKEDSGRGWRRVVPSPKPIDVAEIDVVKTLVDAGHIVITVGGGGVPVVREGNSLIGVPAVIDKDFASEKIAELLDADFLVILTEVDKVHINFGTPNQQSLDELTVNEAKKYISENQFAPGSMLPKVQACMSFAEFKKDCTAIIASLQKAGLALKGQSGTRIINK